MALNKQILDFLLPADIRAVYVERWRADAIARTVWRLANGLRQWNALSPLPESSNPRGSDRPSRGPAGPAGGAAARGFTPGIGARYVLIEVEPVVFLGIDRHWLRLWASDYEEVVNNLTSRQTDDLVDYLERRRHSAIWQLHRTRHQVLRVDSASKDLTIVFSRLLATCEVGVNP